jgi:DNA-binding NarL/FixJ family response regulator
VLPDAESAAIGEAPDGATAVQKAGDMRPDLILLDIGLPVLGGLDAARQIRTLAPQSRILFVSQESSREIVEGVLELGARGYVVKSDVMRELLCAVKAVARGERYLSSSLTGIASLPSTVPTGNKGFEC